MWGLGDIDREGESKCNGDDFGTINFDENFNPATVKA